MAKKKAPAPAAPQVDVYCGLLVVSFVALLTASILLYVQLREYGL